MQGARSRVALLSVDGPAGSAGTWAGGNEEETAPSCARTGARVSHAPSGFTLWGRTRYHSRLTDEETEARGRAGKAELPAAGDGCPHDFRLSQRGDPEGACDAGEHQGRGLLHVGVPPRLSARQRGKGCRPRRKRSRCPGRRGHVSTEQALELKALRQRWLARLPEVLGCPLCLRTFPGLTKATAVPRGCHLQLRPLGLWQRRRADGRKVQSQQTLCFSEGRVLRCGAGPAVGGTCLSLYCTLEGG